jgi:flagellar biosynthesis protein FlhF
MELRRFVAPTMVQCLSQMRSQMGSGAVVLSTRTIQMRRWLGLFSSQHVEITAGRGLRTAPRRRSAFAPTPAGRSSAPGRELLSTPAAVGAAYMGVSQEISELRKIIGDLATQIRDNQSPEIPRAFADCYRALSQQQVSEPMARQLISAAREAAGDQEVVSPAHARALVCREIERALKTGGALAKSASGRPHVMALIGPTGVGKTTTIAKLAANLKLREGRKVGLITIDTYRIAAIDQLRKYAEIISAPLCVISHPSEMRQAITGMADCDFILIDTAGRSPKDDEKLRQLGTFLRAAMPDEVHLVLSSVGAMASVWLALERFGEVRADRLIFTKLDEAAQVGVLLDAVAHTNLPLSYLTHGQDVPNDIEVASPTKLALMMTDPPSRKENSQAQASAID